MISLELKLLTFSDPNQEAKAMDEADWSDVDALKLVPEVLIETTPFSKNDNGSVVVLSEKSTKTFSFT